MVDTEVFFMVHIVGFLLANSLQTRLHELVQLKLHHVYVIR